VITASQPPLLAKHRQKGFLDRHRRRHHPRHRCAARTLCMQQASVEQRAAGVRIDFDQMRTVCAEVKVIPQENAGGTGRMPRQRRRVGEHAFAIRRQGHQPFEQGDDPCHTREMLGADENHAVRKQMRSRRQQFSVRERSVAFFERALQGSMIDRDAGAAAIEQFSRRSAVQRQEIGSSLERGGHADQATAAGAKKARASASSRVLFIGGRLRQTRLP
jgi:hypothetical protein